jgi:SHAQKYF class myb-like DNA-binding protein
MSFVWSKEVHQHFCKAVQNVGIEHAKPRKIADQMALLLPDAPSRPSSKLISSYLQKYKQLHASPSYAGSNLKDAYGYAATNTTTAPDHPTTSVYAAQSTTAVFKVGDVVRCTISPTAVCRTRSIFKVTHDGKTAGDGCGDGQFIIQLVKPHNKCIIDPSHLMTFKVNGSMLVGPLPPDTVISNYAEMGSHNEFVQPDEDTVTRSQL